MSSQKTLHIEGFFDPATWTISYIALDQSSGHCALIDSVLDYDPKSGRTSFNSANILIDRVKALDATVEWILETHVHADHLSAAAYLQNKLGGKLGIGQHITTVQKVFGSLFNIDQHFVRDGSQFDHLFTDGETFKLGNLDVQALHTPGHTPACMTYVIKESNQPIADYSAFIGDTLFMPDYGTARCDFPGGDARTLFRSINKVLSLPANTKLYMCHDYQPNGREVQFITTVAEERAHNIHVRNGISEDEFVTMRTRRDATLEMPVLILPSVQINMRAGHLPEAESNGTSYLKIPINAL